MAREAQEMRGTIFIPAAQPGVEPFVRSNHIIGFVSLYFSHIVFAMSIQLWK